MIAHLKGILAQMTEDSLVVDVGGVGYLVYGSSRTLGEMPPIGDAVDLRIETVLRAESLTLYGFRDDAERSWFRLLQTVQGVGARVALAILSTLTPDQMSQAILAKDKGAFTRANGVGPRLAARLVSELQSRVGELPASAAVIQMPTIERKAGGSITEDAVSALVNLGYARSEAHGAVARAASREDGTNNVEALIREGLKELGLMGGQTGA